MRPFHALTFALASLALPAAAEEQVACTILGCEKVNIEISDFADANDFTVKEVWSVVNDILGVSGLAPNFQVVETQEVGNAAAIIIKERRYLAFNPVWMRTYRNKPDSKWQLYAVMAHEVGHHLQGHTITAGGSRPPTELEADEYAGFTLAALGATLDQTQALWKTFGEQGSATHPPRRQRLEAVQRGWERRKGASAPTPAAQNAPPRRMEHAPRAQGETCRSFRMGIGTAEVCASSTLDQQKGNSYDLRNLFDGNLSTAWVEGVQGTGGGEQITFSFEAPTTPRSLEMVNGYMKSQKSYADNSRVKNILLTASNGASGTMTVRDTGQLQTFNLDIGEVEWIRLMILGTHQGNRWQDTAISEMMIR